MAGAILPLANPTITCTEGLEIHG